MNTKKLITLAAVLAVIVALIIAANQLGSRKPSAKSLAFFPKFSEQTCSSILIVEKADSVRIRKKGDVWIVAPFASDAGTAPVMAGTEPEAAGTGVEYPADSASIATALEKLTGMKRDDLISQNPEKQSLFEVDSARGIYVEAFDEKQKSYGGFYIGKSGPDYSSHYVRLVGSNDVYSVSNSIRYSFFADRKRWRDKLVVSFDRGQAEKIVIAKQAGNTFVIDKSTDTSGQARWSLSTPQQAPAKTQAMDDLLNTLSNFRCADYEENAALADTAMGFGAPELVVTVTLSGGTEKKVVVGKMKEPEKKFWVRTPDRKFTYLFDEWNISKLDKNIGDLKDATAVPGPLPAQKK